MADVVDGRLMERRRGRTRVFYGWWVVTAAAGLQALQAALFGQAYGAYVPLLHAELGWSKTMLSAAASLREAESGVLGPIQGALLDRLGPRKVASAGLGILALGFVLFSGVQEPWQFFAAFFVMSVGATLCGFLTASFVAVQWFERRRATAIAIASAGFAVGGMCVPATAAALDAFGWRATALLSGALVALLGLPLAQVYRRQPRDLGLEPDGAPPPPRATSRSPSSAPPQRPSFTLGEALRTPAFWLIAFGHSAALLVVSSVGIHLVSHLHERLGYSLAEASRVVLALTFMFLVGNLTGGLLGDRVNRRALLVLCMGMHGVGLLTLSHAGNGWMVLAFVLVHGLAWGWRGPQMTAIRADYFGPAAFGTIMGVSNAVILTGTVLGPLVAGVLYDWTGDYRLGFDLLALVALAGSVFFLLARKPAPPVRAPSSG